jgi:hypothetical protein
VKNNAGVVKGDQLRTGDVIDLTGRVVSRVVVTPTVIERHHGTNRMTAVTAGSLVRVRPTSRVE